MQDYTFLVGSVIVTANSNPILVAVACVIGALVYQMQKAYAKVNQRLEQLSARLGDGLAAAAKKVGAPHTLVRVGSMMTLFFNPEVVHDWSAASRSDTKRFAKYFWELIDRGVYMPCSQYEALFVSSAHTEADIDATIDAAGEAIKASN